MLDPPESEATVQKPPRAFWPNLLRPLGFAIALGCLAIFREFGWLVMMLMFVFVSVAFLLEDTRREQRESQQRKEAEADARPTNSKGSGR